MRVFALLLGLVLGFVFFRYSPKHWPAGVRIVGGLIVMALTMSVAIGWESV